MKHLRDNGSGALFERHGMCQLNAHRLSRAALDDDDMLTYSLFMNRVKSNEKVICFILSFNTTGTRPRLLFRHALRALLTWIRRNQFQNFHFTNA